MYVGDLSSEYRFVRSLEIIDLFQFFFSVTTVFALVVGKERPEVDKVECIRKKLKLVQLRQSDLRCAMHKVTDVGRYYDVIISIGYTF